MVFKPLLRRENSETRGRHLVATENIPKGQLIFVERPMIMMQSTGNIHEGVLVCHYCMAFCGKPEQCLEVSANPACLPDIVTKEDQQQQQQQQTTNIVQDGEYALIPCRHKCGQFYCSKECQDDDWEWGGHKELCTGWISDVDHPLVKFKQHAVETNEIFLIVGQWLARILKHNLPYHDDDRLQTHPYTDFQMNPWWDVSTVSYKNQPMGFAEAIEVEKSCKRLCEESSAFLREAWPDHKDSKWLTPLGLARLIGSLEQNCVGIRRKHAIRKNIMEDADLRRSCHLQLIKCLERAGMIGEGDDDEEEGNSDNCCTDEEEIHEDVNESSDKNKTTNNDDKDENGQEEKSPVDEEEWDYSHEEIAEFLSNVEALPDLGKDDGWDEIFTPLDGTAHFSIATKMNHSCEPNVIILYSTRGWGRSHPLVAYCVALTDISADEELTISYIVSDDPYETRQAALANYGFACSCPKCQREKNNLPTKEGESATKDTNDDMLGGDNENDDENDLFGDDEDDDDNDDNGGDNSGADYQKQLDGMSGEEKLIQLAERLESQSNNSDVASIPLTYLGTVSNYLIHLAKDFETEIEESNQILDDFVATDLSRKCVDAIQSRDFCSCRVVGTDLESHLFRLLKSKGSFPHSFFRKTYWCATITAAVGYANEGSFLTAMNFLDKALTLGQSRSDIDSFFFYVEIYASQTANAPCPSSVSCKIPDFEDQDLQSILMNQGLSKPLSNPVEVFLGDAEEFSKLLENTREPLVIRKFASKWPATTKWRDIGHLVHQFGHRLVPIEVGSMSTGMKEELVSFRDFVSTYLAPSSEKLCWSLEDATIQSKGSKVAYLAQHPLLDQIRAFYEDVETNPFGISPTNVNAWIGTGGTRTPLHFDSYDNLFVQLVGVKYVRLYDASMTSRLYVSTDKSYGLQGNMSQVDCEMEDFDKFPLLKDCPYTEVLMQPGDCLFMPSRCWHYVRSLSTSISVNYWF